MPNENYQKGRRLEYELTKAFNAAGCRAWRSAGSHGPYDIMAIGTESQIGHGWQNLYAKGFQFGCDRTSRVGKKYCDHLYVKTFGPDGEEPVPRMITLIQAKRTQLVKPRQVRLAEMARGKYGKK